MPATANCLPAPPLWLGTLFDRIVCGVDGSEESLVAVRQAAHLLPARRILELVAVAEEVPERPPATAADERNRRSAGARKALARALRIHPSAYGHVCFGIPGPTLVAFAREAPATLLVVAAPTNGRHDEPPLDSVGTYLVQNAVSSVLIARPCIPADAFPRSIVVGHDGSRTAAHAAHLTSELAHRFGASMRIVAATGGTAVAVDQLPEEGEIEWSPLEPLDALTAASKEADLLIVGNRGVGGASSLGSVSKSVGHLAHCSVLVLREPPERRHT